MVKELRWIKINTVPVFRVGETKPYEVYTIFNDITKQKNYEMNLKDQQEQMLEAEKEKNEILQKDIEQNRIIQQQTIDIERLKLKTMIDDLPVAVGIIDHNGAIIDVNDATIRMWGGKAPFSKDVSEYKEYKAWDVDTGKLLEPEEWPIAKVLKTGEAVTGEVMEIERFDGTHGTIINSATPIKDAEGNVVNIFSIAVDITDNKKNGDSVT